MLLISKVLCQRNSGITTHSLFSKPFLLFLTHQDDVINLISPLPAVFVIVLTSMCILIFPASEYIDVTVLINQVSLGRIGVANRQITKAYVPFNESNISNLLFPQECICFLYCFRAEPSIICRHVFIG